MNDISTSIASMLHVRRIGRRSFLKGTLAGAAAFLPFVTTPHGLTLPVFNTEEPLLASELSYSPLLVAPDDNVGASELTAEQLVPVRDNDTYHGVLVSALLDNRGYRLVSYTPSGNPARPWTATFVATVAFVAKQAQTNTSLNYLAASSLLEITEAIKQLPNLNAVSPADAALTKHQRLVKAFVLSNQAAIRPGTEQQQLALAGLATTDYNVTSYNNDTGRASSMFSEGANPPIPANDDQGRALRSEADKYFLEELLRGTPSW